MPYTIARHAGYCAGVRKAMELAFRAAREAREQGVACYSLGELIHNPDAVNALHDLPRGFAEVIKLVDGNNLFVRGDL